MTLNEYLDRMVRAVPEDDFLSWPPDVFGVCAQLLQRTGLYTHVGKKWPPRGTLRGWAEFIYGVGQEWWLYATGCCHDRAESKVKLELEVPAEVKRWWTTLRQHGATEVSTLRDAWDRRTSREVAYALLQLCAAADEASDYICIRRQSPHLAHLRASGVLKPATLEKLARYDFAGVGYSAFHGKINGKAGYRVGNLCWRTLGEDISVLPHYHTPNRGLTLRSLSHNLSFMDSAEVYPYWSQAHFGEIVSDYLQALLIPWPWEIDPASFQPVKAGCGPGKNGKFFDFVLTPEQKKSRLRWIRQELPRIVSAAKAQMHTIHFVVFPEVCFLGDHELRAALSVLRRHAPTALIIGGFGRPPKPRQPAENFALFVLPGDTDKVLGQRKHHRWCIDEFQRARYGMNNLPADELWWEGCEISRRRVRFQQMANMSFCALICEDLARQEPVAQLVRAVGPNLIFALLMDGEQNERRWGARYAGSFAEDPGSSVLVLTSLGMALRRRWNHDEHTDDSVAIGYWQDPSDRGRVIRMPTNAAGVILHLEMREDPEITADGRESPEHAIQIVLKRDPEPVVLAAPVVAMAGGA